MPAWPQMVFPKLKNGSSAFLFGARRTIHRMVNAFEDSGFLMKDTLARKNESALHRAQRVGVVRGRRGLAATENRGWPTLGQPCTCVRADHVAEQAILRWRHRRRQHPQDRVSGMNTDGYCPLDKTLSALTGQCMHGRRIGDLEGLRRKTVAWALT